MIINTKEFKEAASKILVALATDKNAANLEIETKDDTLRLNVTNNEFYVSVKFTATEVEQVRAVVKAKTFLDIIAGLTSETFRLTVDENKVNIKTGRSNYNIAMIYDFDGKLINLPKINVTNATVTMPIDNNILHSILDVNTREIQKLKSQVTNELQKMYYIDEAGCITFSYGACMNRFTLDKPVKMLLNERIVKLFKLFNEPVTFSLGHEFTPSGLDQTRIAFENDNVSVYARITNDEVILNPIATQANKVKLLCNTKYPNCVVVSLQDLSAAINRLVNYVKNTDVDCNSAYIPASVTCTKEMLIIRDKTGSIETVDIENDSYVEDTYVIPLNLVDLKSACDSCKVSDVTINFGNHTPLRISHESICHILQELDTSQESWALTSSEDLVDEELDD